VDVDRRTLEPKRRDPSHSLDVLQHARREGGGEEVGGSGQLVALAGRRIERDRRLLRERFGRSASDGLGVYVVAAGDVSIEEASRQ
jgi:hypothetical protein